MFNILKRKKIEFIIVGLGNPGDKYKKTRHNVGFIAIDHIIKEKNIATKKLKHQAEIFTTTLANHRVLLVKPQTFMNLSGNSVEEIINYYKIPIVNVIVISDDISLPIGKLRIKRKGSDGGHNGLKDIIFKTGFDTFPRIKIGVGAKPVKWNLANWVLSEFTDSEFEKINAAVKNTYKALELIVSSDIDSAMNKFNS